MFESTLSNHNTIYPSLYCCMILYRTRHNFTNNKYVFLTQVCGCIDDISIKGVLFSLCRQSENPKLKWSCKMYLQVIAEEETYLANIIICLLCVTNICVSIIITLLKSELEKCRHFHEIIRDTYSIALHML